MGCNSSKKKENQAVRHWDEQSAGGSRRNIRGNNAPQHSTPQQPHGSSKPVGISRNDNNKTGQNQYVAHTSHTRARAHTQKAYRHRFFVVAVVCFWRRTFRRAHRTCCFACHVTHSCAAFNRCSRPVFEDEFVLSTSTQNRLKEHELMNAIITRSAGQFVDVNPASDMMEDEDPFEISREFSSQVLNAEIRAGDEMPVPQIPPQSGVATQQVLETLAKHSVTTQELSEIDNVAYLLADALSQVSFPLLCAPHSPLAWSGVAIVENTALYVLCVSPQSILVLSVAQVTPQDTGKDMVVKFEN